MTKSQLLCSVTRECFDPLVCKDMCSSGRTVIPYAAIEDQVAKALKLSKGKLTAAVLAPIKKHFQQYMPLPSKSSDPVYRRLEKAPFDPRTVGEDEETELIGFLYRTLKQDFMVSLLMRFANPARFCTVSQPIRKAARWMGIRVSERRAVDEYIGLVRAMRTLSNELNLERVADLDQGLLAFYFTCLAGEGKSCTNFEALTRSRHQSALSNLGDAAQKASDLRVLFAEAHERLDELEDEDRGDFLDLLVNAVTDFGSEMTEELETRKQQFLKTKAQQINKHVSLLSEKYPALTHFSLEAKKRIAGGYVMWLEHQEGVAATPGLIAILLGQAFEHELRNVVFKRINPPNTNGQAYTWLVENDPTIAKHEEASAAWRKALDCTSTGPKFDTLIRLAEYCCDPELIDSILCDSFRTSLQRAIPIMPDTYSSQQLAEALDVLREHRNRCTHQITVGKKLGPKAAEVVFGELGILQRLSAT